MRTLKRWQIRGRMFNMLNSFMSKRTFQVYAGGYVSRLFELENGVPQGSVLSVTLFLVAIQPVFRVVSNNVKILVYADDILLIVRGAKGQPLYRKLQKAVKAVNKWATSVGFCISAAKSTIFYRSPNLRREPTGNICIDRQAIPKTTKLKILGVVLDRTLNFKAHCKQVKESCESRLRILKIIGGRLPRGERTSLLRIGSAIITSRLIYGVGLISRGGETVVQVLAPLYNRMVRFASGAFVTSPIASIMAEVGVLPFELVFLQSITRLAIRLLEKSHENESLPLVQRVSQRLEEEIGMRLPKINVRLNLTSRKWFEPKPHVTWNVKKRVKAGDPPNIVRPVVQQLLMEQFPHYQVIYTDGSKSCDTVGASVFSEGWQKSVGLPSQCSVFSAEAFALKTAVANPIPPNGSLILSDSASCLLAIEAGSSKHPWIQEIEYLVRYKPVIFCWIPGHAELQSHECFEARLFRKNDNPHLSDNFSMAVKRMQSLERNLPTNLEMRQNPVVVPLIMGRCDIRSRSGQLELESESTPSISTRIAGT
ncbi:uncharacterized protein LOC131693120 [Topomyia yanbarensis]|uniref:uncharacterized protein LOC131693120 n=1 Tax=Topomyia yanbarensis TaxID=2498891 RepID=UPI00273C9251|nr:uncharacterized protein LOC131693120 [Topomyia yanbarensis]